MALRSAFILALIAFPLDIIYETIYQANFRANFNTELEKFPGVLNLIKTQHIDKFKHHALHSISHTISHLLIHLGLIYTSAVFVMAILSNSFCAIAENACKTLNFLFLSSFMSLSPMEMLLLQLEHFIVIFFECSFYFSHVFGFNILVSLLWIIVLIFFYIPLHVRAKVYLEHKLRYVAPIAMAAVFSTTIYIYKYVSFKIDLGIYHHLVPITNSFPILERFCKEHGIGVEYYSSNDKYYDKACSALSLFTDRNIILYGSLGKLSPREIEAALLHESFAFSWLGMLDTFILPTLEKFLFAGLCIFFSKRFLKHFCSKHIGHITAFLILEECLSLGVQRFIFFPINIIRLGIEHRADAMVKASGLGMEYAKFLLLSEVDAHLSHINPSNIYQLFHCEGKLFNRIEFLIS
ncbi:hypothetical protein PAEPH01_0619 [Pancytospora epiphaga]|nr:hypothetical protein PAEPH01_0619 [Pancytospora epiphaga]